MKKIVFIILALVVSVYLFGYAKEKQPTTTTLEGATKILQPRMDNIPSDFKSPPPLEVKDARVQDIQTALKNTGHYKGPIDGKNGPLTKEAVKDFQKANGLKVDGKVGRKTWGVLSPYLNPETVPTKPSNARNEKNSRRSYKKDIN